MKGRLSMSINPRTLIYTFVASVLMVTTASAEEVATVKEVALDAPHGVKIRVRMEGPYTADVPLQVVCYFPYSKEAVAKMAGAPVELDRHLGGVIGSLRERGEFSGYEQETLLFKPPAGSIPAQNLLLIGLGSEKDVSLDVMSRVGRTALREAAALDVKRVAFAPLIRDQGNSALPAGDVEVAILKAMLLSYDTQKRLQSEKLAKEFVLQEWIVEAGPAYFDDTVAGAKKAIQEAHAAISQRPAIPYQTAK
jgi:cytosol aminopeptidase family protein